MLRTPSSRLSRTVVLQWLCMVHTRVPAVADSDEFVRQTEAAATLPQIALEEIESDEYLEQLPNATGILFGGAQQWHFILMNVTTAILYHWRERVVCFTSHLAE